MAQNIIFDGTFSTDYGNTYGIGWSYDAVNDEIDYNRSVPPFDPDSVLMAAFSDAEFIDGAWYYVKVTLKTMPTASYAKARAGGGGWSDNLDTVGDDTYEFYLEGGGGGDFEVFASTPYFQGFELDNLYVERIPSPLINSRVLSGPVCGVVA